MRYDNCASIRETGRLARLVRDRHDGRRVAGTGRGCTRRLYRRHEGESHCAVADVLANAR